MFAEVVVQVSNKDVLEGIQHSHTSCPIARAIKRRVKPELRDQVEVGFKTAKVGDWLAPLPDRAQDFVMDFDDGAEVDPFRFKLEVPVEYMEAKAA